MIQQTGAQEFQTTARGCDYTLRFERDEWVVYVVNAAVRAWNNGFATPKFFATLADVESKYKAFRGIAALIAA